MIELVTDCICCVLNFKVTPQQALMQTMAAMHQKVCRLFAHRYYSHSKVTECLQYSMSSCKCQPSIA